MADAHADVIAGIDLDAEEYTVEQSLVRNKYAVYGPDGALLLKTRQKLFKMKEEFPFEDPDGDRVLATISSESALIEALRNISTLFNLLPHTYTIEGPDGEELGAIEGHFSLRDRYTIRLGDTGDAPREGLVAACVAIDALEGN